LDPFTDGLSQKNYNNFLSIKSLSIM